MFRPAIAGVHLLHLVVFFDAHLALMVACAYIGAALACSCMLAFVLVVILGVNFGILPDC